MGQQNTIHLLLIQLLCQIVKPTVCSLLAEKNIFCHHRHSQGACIAAVLCFKPSEWLTGPLTSWATVAAPVHWWGAVRRWGATSCWYAAAGRASEWLRNLNAELCDSVMTTVKQRAPALYCSQQKSSDCKHRFYPLKKKKEKEKNSIRQQQCGKKSCKHCMQWKNAFCSDNGSCATTPGHPYIRQQNEEQKAAMAGPCSASRRSKQTNKQTQPKFLKLAHWREKNKPAQLLLRAITGNRKTVKACHSWVEGMSGYTTRLEGSFPHN